MTFTPLAELVVPGKRLGRHVRHDPRSLAYALPESPAQSVTWARHIPILDQGDLGSCTGNATVGALGSRPLWDALDASTRALLNETLAKAIYSDAEKLDGGAGLPSEDQGSSGLSVAKVAKSDGYVSGYQHATSVGAAHTALAAGPFITGTNWYSGMDSPSSEGIVTATGTVRGAHEYVCREYDAARDLWWLDNSWGTSYGVQGRFAYDSDTFERLLSQSGDVTAFVPADAPAPTPNPPAGRTVTFTDAEMGDLTAWALSPHWWAKATAAAKAWKEVTA